MESTKKCFNTGKAQINQSYPRGKCIFSNSQKHKIQLLKTNLKKVTMILKLFTKKIIDIFIEFSAFIFKQIKSLQN